MKEAPPAGGFGDQKGTALGPVVEVDPPMGEVAAAGEEALRKPSKVQAVLAGFGWICLVPSGLLMLLVIFGSLMTLSMKCGDPSGPSHEGSRAVMLLVMLGFYLLPALPAYLFLTRRSKTTSGAIGGLLFSIFALVTSVFGVFIGALSHMC
jgi:hypothetical protein